jgi:hypothetical protein
MAPEDRYGSWLCENVETRDVNAANLAQEA